MNKTPTIPEFYTNKTVFITGGSGFIGKILIEKILRSCPDVKTIYLLMRQKKGKSIDERIKAITDLPIFDLVKSQNPEVLKKIKVVNGDVREVGLGMRPEDVELLVKEVNIVFHVAASVRFDDSLTEAVLMNTRGAREVVSLALEMKNLDVLVHVSTTYCHTDYEVIEEKHYPPHADWKKTIEIAEKVDKHTLNALTEKYIQPLSNTYTFTKSLAEHVVFDLCKDRIPAVIYRPSVVVSSFDEPIRGWMDNFNGPMGLIAGVGKGVVRTVFCNSNINTDYIPVDLTVKAMMMASWKQAIDTQKLTPCFYNGSNNGAETVTTKEILERGHGLYKNAPLDYVIWYPDCTFTKCFTHYYILLVLYHLIPALLIDGLLKLLGQKPMLVRLHRKIYLATRALEYFTFNEWEFRNDKCYNLQNQLLPSDVEAFSYKDEESDLQEFMEYAVFGIRKYLLKEGDDREAARRHYKRMWWLYVVFNTFWYLTLFWFLFIKVDVLKIFCHAVLYLIPKGF